MNRLLVFSALLIASVANAQPPSLTIPAEVKPAGQYARIAPTTDAVAVTYIGLSGVDAIPSDLLKDGRMFLLDTRGLAAGRYKFAAVGASKTGEQTRVDFVVVVGDAPPPFPPGPDPAPPFDPLLTVWQAIYASDLSPTKAADKAALAAVYKQGAETAKNPSLATAGQLRKVMADAATVLIGARLAPLRQAIWVEVVKLLPAEDTPLTEAKRQEVAALFLRVSSILEQVR